MEKNCPNCNEAKLEVFYNIKNVPVHSVLLMDSKDEAIGYTRGDIILGYCNNCGFYTNTAFEPSKHEYSSRYEETQGFSSTFNKFHKALADRLIEKFDLHNKEIIEIGCGKGEFITMLCELGGNTGYGFDPAYISERNVNSAKDRITFINDFYSEKYTGYHSDFVCCKMTLEHIPDTLEFMQTVRRSIGERYETTVFFQIPNGRWVLEGIGFWDIYYEHCSYFSMGSLAKLFSKAGFDVLEISSEYDNQYLAVEAKPSNNVLGSVINGVNDKEEMIAVIKEFAHNITKRLDCWKSELTKYESEGKKVVLWGGGSKGVAFLTTLGITNFIKYAVDINPFKHGTFMAGTGQEIVSPEFLQSYKPDLVIIMNPIYTYEIRNDLNKLGLSTELISIEEDFES